MKPHLTAWIGAFTIFAVGAFIGSIIGAANAEYEDYRDIPCTTGIFFIGNEKPDIEENIQGDFYAWFRNSNVIIKAGNPRANKDIYGYFVCPPVDVVSTSTSTLAPTPTLTPVPLPTPTPLPTVVPTPCLWGHTYLGKEFGDVFITTVGCNPPATEEDLVGNTWYVSVAQFYAIREIRATYWNLDKAREAILVADEQVIMPEPHYEIPTSTPTLAPTLTPIPVPTSTPLPTPIPTPLPTPLPTLTPMPMNMPMTGSD